MSQKIDWLVRGVSADTRRLVKRYAAEYSLTHAQALDELIQAAFALHEQQKATTTPDKQD